MQRSRASGVKVFHVLSPSSLQLAGWRDAGKCVQSYTVIGIEWDPKKAASSHLKHGVRFADAVSVLEDERAITVRDDSVDEERWVSIGMDAFGRVLVVVYTFRKRNARLISARVASKQESRHYMENL